MPEIRKEQTLNTSQPQVPETIEPAAEELLLDDILREFGDGKKQKSASSDPIDDEVQKILLSVQSSLEEGTTSDVTAGLLKTGAEGIASYPSKVAARAIAAARRNTGTDIISADGADATVTPINTKIELPIEMQPVYKENEKNQDKSLNSVQQNTQESKVNRKDDLLSKTVKVVSEDDSSPIFGDNFAKYFGPEAGLATHIKMTGGDIVDEDGEPIKKKRGLFHRKKRQPKEVSDLSESSEDPPKGALEDDPVAKQQIPVEAEEILDINAEEAIKSIINEMGFIRLRMMIGSLLCLPLLYVALVPKLGLYLPEFLTYVRDPYLHLFVTCALQILVMIMCVETFATGLRDLLTLKPNMESVVAYANILSLAHALSIILFPQWEGYYPYSAVCAISLLFASYYRQKNKMARLRSYKTATAMTKPYLVVCEKGINGGSNAAVKYKAAAPLYFVNQTERRDAAAKFWSYAAPLLMVLTIICAAVSSFGTGQPQRFLWNLSALAAAAAPLSLCLCFNLPFAKAAKHLGLMGEAIAGWSAAEEFSSADSLIVTDTDLFPPGSITLNGLKIFGGYAVDKVISYSASLISVSGAGTARPFMELLHDQSAAQRKVVNFRHYENGGIGGDINGESVIAGSSTFMLRTGIKIPKDINIKNAVYIAINQELAGIFAVNYNIQVGVKKAVTVLRKNGITPVLAIRDFNVTPTMIEAKFNISTDTADFPPIGERLALSNPDRIFIAKPSAVISREGLGHYAECVVCARNLKKTTRVCLGLTAVSILIGVLLMFYLTYTHSPVQASPANLLAYMGLWLIPNLLAASWVKL